MRHRRPRRQFRSERLRALSRLEPDDSSADPGHDYLLALAETERAILVSGDQHLPALGEQLPIQSARAFLDKLAGA
jgi:hypothetical protein